jgi:hypothetical protein
MGNFYENPFELMCLRQSLGIPIKVFFAEELSKIFFTYLLLDNDVELSGYRFKCDLISCRIYKNKYILKNRNIFGHV